MSDEDLHALRERLSHESVITHQRIDTKEGINAMIGNGESLAGLTQLRKERVRWRKEHPHQPLSEWYVLGGLVYLDKFGQSHVASFDGDVSWVHEVRNHETDRPGLRTTWSSTPIPRNIDSCLHCGGEITARQLKAVCVGSYNNEADRLDVWHGECRILWIDAERRLAFSEAFCKAGLSLPALRSMPSQYSETKWTGPWYRVESPELGTLLVGLRKRVIYLGWEQNAQLAAVDGREVFCEEGVTVGEKFIHAWGIDKLIEYLATLKRSI